MEQKNNAVKSARIAAGMTQHQLADAAGIQYTQIWKLEHGEIKAGKMRASTLFAISDALGVDARSLLEG